MTIEITYTPSLKNYLTGSIYNFFYQSFQNKRKLWLDIFVILFGIGAWIIFGFSPVYVFLMFFPIWFVLLIVLCGSFYFLGEPKFRQMVHLVFSDEGILYKTAHIDSKLNWDLYCDFLETPYLFLLFYGKSMYTTIPKAAFMDQSQLGSFRKLVHSKLKMINSPSKKEDLK